MKHLRMVCTVFVVLALSACIRIELNDGDFPYGTRQPIDANAVAVGISMKVKSLFDYSPVHKAYFVRLEEKNDI